MSEEDRDRMCESELSESLVVIAEGGGVAVATAGIGAVVDSSSSSLPRFWIIGPSEFCW